MSAARTIQIEYYAILREQRGAQKEEVLSDSETPRALYDELRALHGFSLEPSRLKVVVNDVFVEWDTALNDGDRVVFIPPVAGG